MAVVSLNDLIVCALTGRKYNQQRLGAQAWRYARKLSNRFASKLPDDLHDEVAQQALFELFAKGADGLAVKSGIQLFRAAIFDAIRTIQSDYAQPGARTRAAPPGAKVDRIAAEDVGAIARPRDVERATVVADDVSFIDFDQFESRAAALDVQAMTDRLDVEKILAPAPAPVVRALRLVYFEDVPIQSVAQSLGISRFALNRRFLAVGEPWRVAA